MPPHTTHVLQPTYVVTFCLPKKQFRVAKSAIIIHQATIHQVVFTKGEHMLSLLKHPREAELCREKVVATWKVTGYVPFTL